MNASGFFVTGTDTDVGKTWVTVGLMAALRRHGLRVAGMKPVASGCEGSEGALRNEDALLLQAQCSRPPPYAWVNPCAYADPIAPSIAAARQGQRVRLESIRKAYAALCRQAEIVIVEGVGGWLVPLDDTPGEEWGVPELAHALGLAVVLVVGLRLGCLNHALLSAASIRASGRELAGWIANRREPHYETEAESLRLLTRRLGAPPLAVVPHLPTLDTELLSDCFKPALAGLLLRA